MRKLFIVLLTIVQFYSLYGRANSSYEKPLDIYFAKIEWEVNPEIYYIRGIVEFYFHKQDSTSDFINFDLTSKLKIDSIISSQKSISYIHENNIISIESKLFKNTDSLTIYYSGEPNKSGFETFTQEFHGLNYPILSTLSEPYGASDWWPCQNSVTDKIDSTEITITCPSKYTGISNGILIKTNKKDTVNSYVWKHNYPIASYLIAFAVTNYAQFDLYFKMNEKDSVLIQNFVYPEDSLVARKGILDIEPAFKLFSKQYMPYPFAKEKYGHAQFNWGGGMEHQTISFVTNFEYYLLVHEMSHQWFGDYITCGSFHDIWLNEGFAVFSEGLATEKLIGKQEFINWKQSKKKQIMSEPGGSVYVDDTTDIWRIFDGRLTYAKAGMVLQMLRNQIGDSAFWHGIHSYLKDTALVYNFAMTKDLKRHFEEASGTDLTNFFNECIYGEGYPIFNIKYTISGQSLYLELEEKTSASNPLFHIKIPVKFTGQNRDTLVWINVTQNWQINKFNLGFIPEHIYYDPEQDLIAEWNFSRLNMRKNIVVYPNPAKDELNIFLDKEYNESKIKIYNLKGEILYNDSLKNKFYFKINISNYKKGKYLLIIDNDGNKIKSGFIKE